MFKQKKNKINEVKKILTEIRHSNKLHNFLLLEEKNKYIIKHYAPNISLGFTKSITPVSPVIAKKAKEVKTDVIKKFQYPSILSLPRGKWIITYADETTAVLFGKIANSHAEMKRIGGRNKIISVKKTYLVIALANFDKQDMELFCLFELLKRETNDNKRIKKTEGNVIHLV